MIGRGLVATAHLTAWVVLVCLPSAAFEPTLASWQIDPADIVPEDAHTQWSRFVPMGTIDTADDGFPGIDWANLTNPILASRWGAIKNQAVVFHNGWFWFFPSLPIEQGTVLVRTRDFRTYEYHDRVELFGMAPRLIHRDVRWHALAQYTAPDADRRIYLRASTNLIDWTEPVEAWIDTQKGTRHIDAAIAWEQGRYYVGFKSNQQFHVMRSTTDAIDFQWEEPVRVTSEGWCEAYQFIKIDGQWRMVATGRAPKEYRTGDDGYTGDHEPYLYEMTGDGSKLEHWARWVNKRHIALPFSDWNRVMHANAAYLCNWRVHDGWFYLFFSGANDSTLCRGRGHCKIGVARSRDLNKWYLPGEAEAE